MREIDPHATSRATAFEMWMQAPMPMVTITKTFDVTRLVKVGQRRGLQFNMLLGWCIGRAASQIQEFYLLPVGGKLMQYDALAVNVIVTNKDGGINTCDIPFDNDFEQFSKDYSTLTEQAANECRDLTADDRMVIGTSALVTTELDSMVNMWSGIYANPMLFWGKYRRQLFRATLPISFQFHHVQMDGAEAATFLNALQQEINKTS